VARVEVARPEPASDIHELMSRFRRFGSGQLSVIHDYFQKQNDSAAFDAFIVSCVDHGRVNRRPAMRRLVGDALPALPEQFEERLRYEGSTLPPLSSGSDTNQDW